MQRKDGTFVLPNGREIFLVELEVSQTYRGQLEGSPETATPRILRRLRQAPSEELPHAWPLLVLEPTEFPLPNFRFVAKLISRSAVRTTDADYSSELFLCWFNAKIGVDIMDEIERVLQQVDWEESAEDYDIMP